MQTRTEVSVRTRLWLFTLILGFIFVSLLFVPSRIVFEITQPQIIVWNVGQGQWVTALYGADCWHFDFGGEVLPMRTLIPYCGWRNNRLVLSHQDRDHYNFIGPIKKILRQKCLEGPSWDQIDQKKLGVQGLKLCPAGNNRPLSESTAFSYYNPKEKINSIKKDNDQSQIVNGSHWLIPGDAPRSQERNWVKKQPPQTRRKITHLVLGHHGSNTSTSRKLLEQLPSLRQCIASSRKKKYGHPHREVRTRIKSHCALLTTEDWNHIRFGITSP